MEFNFDVNDRDLMRLLNRVGDQAYDAAEVAMNDVLDELIRIASEITPFDKGILQRSYKRTITRTANDVKGEVEFSVREGSFNYALWIHEGIYNHGEGTQGRSGTSGWSGKRYYVGRKFLERPLQGEAQAFYEYIGNQIRQVVGD